MRDLVPAAFLSPGFLASLFGIAALFAAALSGLLIALLRPLLVRYALARPNARSSHAVPTPQGGGIAVLVAALAAGGLVVVAFGGIAAVPRFGALAGAALLLALLGGVDDIRPLPALFRLAVQIAVVAGTLALLAPGRILPPDVPIMAERALLVLAGVWWINAVNFMDGIDWITCAEMVPLTAAIAAFGIAGWVPPETAGLAAALCGALIGFAPANRPVARLFLGDAGSFPIGLMSGVLLLQLAAAGGLAAALLLPLYHLADATVTLILRLGRRERVWQAHRSHFYQRALDNGFSVLAVDARILVVNLVLAALAATTLAWPAPWTSAAALAVGALLVASTLRAFAAPLPD